MRRLALVAILAAWPGLLVGQIPDRFTNLRVLPEDISRDSLVEVMRGFSFALGVRCQYCHVGGDGISFEGVEFDSDDDPDKRKARFMLRMVQQINAEILTQLPDRDDPPTVIECKTCHRGRSHPVLLRQDLRLVLDRAGADSAVARYRNLRERSMTAGMFDFREWEMNTLGEGLAREGRTADAIAIYRLNEEFYPESLAIKLALARLYEEIGDVPNAIAYYERVLVLRPGLEAALERLEALRRTP